MEKRARMNAEGANDGAVALGPLQWRLIKIEQRWDDRIRALRVEASSKTREIECKHRKERKALLQHLRSSRDAAKANIPLNGRLATMKASRDNLIRLGRVEEAEKVRRKLAPLEEGFWIKALAGIGFAQEAKREKAKLLGVQQAELRSLNLVLRRDIEQALQAKNAEVKAQQRKNPCSSDDVWSIWSAAKSGEAERLSYMLLLPRANVEARDPDSGWTPLHFASRQRELAAVEVLIKNQAFVGARAPDGRTPLHLAAGWGTYEVCFALLQAGADKTVRDRNGDTSQNLAESRQRDKIATLLNGWRPIGLTATQTQKIKESRGEGPMRPWEMEADPEIRAQLRVLDMKRATFGERHAGTRLTLGRLGGLCRMAGRLEEAKSHLETLVGLLEGAPTAGGGERASMRGRVSCASRSSLGGSGALAVALGNLGVVCGEMGDADRASGLLEASLSNALLMASPSGSGGTNQKHLVDAATRNLGLHYLSEGRVEDARPLLRKCLEAYEETVRSDMAGGDESLELIPPLTVLSYADMLAGDHVAAAENSERAQSIAAKSRKHGDALRDDIPGTVAGKAGGLSDPLPRLEWMGVQRFVAGDNASASTLFAQARELVLLRWKKQGCSDSKRAGVAPPVTGGMGAGFDWTAGSGDRGAGLADRFPARGKLAKGKNNKEFEVGTGDAAEPATGEFDPDAMRLDRCMAVCICRDGPEAF